MAESQIDLSKKWNNTVLCSGSRGIVLDIKSDEEDELTILPQPASKNLDHRGRSKRRRTSASRNNTSEGRNINSNIVIDLTIDDPPEPSVTKRKRGRPKKSNTTIIPRMS
ncbi:hypothtical protein, partial [Striga asiatica]